MRSPLANLLLAVLLIALASLVLGMGVPVTAAYLIVAVLAILGSWLKLHLGGGASAILVAVLDVIDCVAKCS